MPGRTGGTSLDISISGVVPTAEMLEAIGQRAIHLDPALREIMDLLLEGERSLWKRSGRKWMRTLAPSTQARHRRQGTAALVESHHLDDSFTKETGRDAIRKAHGEELVFGSSVYYAKFIDKKKRQILVFRPKDKKQTRVILVDHLLGRLGSV
jgi:hypothetical protein